MKEKTCKTCKSYIHYNTHFCLKDGIPIDPKTPCAFWKEDK